MGPKSVRNGLKVEQRRDIRRVTRRVRRYDRSRRRVAPRPRRPGSKHVRCARGISLSGGPPIHLQPARTTKHQEALSSDLPVPSGLVVAEGLQDLGPFLTDRSV